MGDVLDEVKEKAAPPCRKRWDPHSRGNPPNSQEGKLSRSASTSRELAEPQTIPIQRQVAALKTIWDSATGGGPEKRGR